MAATVSTEDNETTDSAQLHEQGKSFLSVVSAMEKNLARDVNN